MNTRKEQWSDISRYPNYQASSEGNIRNKSTGRVLKSTPDRYGYLRLSLGNNDNIPVHRLVCEAFHGVADDYRNHVNHKDGDRKNNRESNLEWCTPSENIKHGVDHGKINPMIGVKKAAEVNQRPVRIVELNKTFSSVKECANFLGVPPTNVSRCLVGQRKGQKLHGYSLEHVGKED